MGGQSNPGQARQGRILPRSQHEVSGLRSEIRISEREGDIVGSERTALVMMT